MLAEHPALERSFADSDPTLASAAAAWKDGIPLPQSVAAFVAPPFFRPPGSHPHFISTLALRTGIVRAAGSWRSRVSNRVQATSRPSFPNCNSPAIRRIRWPIT